jgi:hypothetical protein
VRLNRQKRSHRGKAGPSRQPGSSTAKLECRHYQVRRYNRRGTDTGYNRWADANNIIVLYAQIAASLMNPKGCWDWFAYDSADYAVKKGPQMAAVKAILDRIAGRLEAGRHRAYMHMLKKGQMLAADGRKLSTAEQIYSFAAGFRRAGVRSRLPEINATEPAAAIALERMELLLLTRKMLTPRWAAGLQIRQGPCTGPWWARLPLPSAISNTLHKYWGCVSNLG